MNCATGVVALAVLLALPVPARTQTAVAPVSKAAADVPAKLDALIAARKFDAAEELLRERITQGADPGITFFQIGKIYFDHQEWQRSATYLEKSLAVNRVNDEAHQLLGLDWRVLHRPDDAEAELLEAVKENPAKSENQFFAGHQLLLDGKFEAALPYLYKAVEWKPLQPQALPALALAQARLGNYGLAETYYRKAIDSIQESGQDCYPALVNLAVLLLLEHDPARLAEGLNCAERAIPLHPNSPEGHYLAGKALYKLARVREALPELERAAKISPQDSKPHFLLAEIFAQLGQPDRARKEREAVAGIQKRSRQSGAASGNPLETTNK